MNPIVSGPGVESIRLDEVVKQIRNLPVLPAVVLEMLDTSDEDEIDIQSLVHQVSQDQALAAKTLQFANSPFYGIQAKVTTIQQAVTLLGMHSVRNLITTAALNDCFPIGHCAGFDFEAFWRHSIGTAICARVLAMHLHLNLDYAYTAGLLHDVGRLVLVTRFPRHYEAVIAYRTEHDCSVQHAEQAVIGVDHAIAGDVLAQHWNFHETLRLAIAEHHSPSDTARHALASVIHVADGIAHALDLSGAEDDLVPTLSDVGWHCLAMSHDAYLHVFRETELQFAQASRVLPS